MLLQQDENPCSLELVSVLKQIDLNTFFQKAFFSKKVYTLPKTSQLEIEQFDGIFRPNMRGCLKPHVKKSSVEVVWVGELSHALNMLQEMETPPKCVWLILQHGVR